MFYFINCGLKLYNGANKIKFMRGNRASSHANSADRIRKSGDESIRDCKNKQNNCYEHDVGG